MNIIGYSDYVEYRLVSKFQGAVVIEEPINFEDGNDSIYERDKESKGFFVNKSNTLEFYRTGADFLRRQINARGIAEPVLLQKYTKSEDRIDQAWSLRSESYIDMKTLVFDEGSSNEGIAKANASEGGLKKVIDSKMSDDFDLIGTTNFDGIDIGSLPVKTVLLEPKKIFLRSRIEAEPENELVYTVTSGDDDDGRAIPFRIDIKSDENIKSVLFEDLAFANEDYAKLTSGQIGNLFYDRADRTRTIVLNGYCEVEVKRISPFGTGGIIEMALLRYVDGSEFNFGGRVLIMDSSNTVVVGQKLSYQFVNYEITLQQGDSLTIGVSGRNLFDGIAIKINTAFLEITEDSSFPSTTTRAITYYDAANRLLQLITGRGNAVKSILLTEGPMSEKLITQGFWVRGFPDIVQEGTDRERRIQFVMSLKELVDDINAHQPIAWWVEKGDDGIEYFHIEEYSYTQQNFVGVRYGNTLGEKFVYTPASDVERSVLGDNFFSTIIVGAAKGGSGYEEVFGLQSIQGKAEYGTINNNSESKYEVLSPWRLGDIDVELPRRKPYSEYPDEDTKYDSDKIVLDCKIISDQYYLKKWTDVFAEPPIGLYDYESAYNLEHTPARMLLRHSGIINSGLYHYPFEKLRFQSSNCNSSFKSRKTGENLLEEGTDISHELFLKPYVRPWGVSLVAKITPEIEDALIGKSFGTPNWFGLIAIEVKGNIEYFRLIKADVNAEGKHELVEAYIL